MSRRQELQDATGVVLRVPPVGVSQIVQFTTPTNGQPGFAPGCIWVNLGATSSNGQGFEFLNIGTNASSRWVCTDSTSSNQGQFGSSVGTYFSAGGNIFRDVSSAGKNPSATAADKIVAAFTLPASAFDVAGRMLDIMVWGQFANNANSKRAKVFFGATNTNPAVDGSVTVTGGTAIMDSTAITTTGGGGWYMTGQLVKYGAAAGNTQQSMMTGVVFGGTHSGVGTPANQTFTESAAALIVVTVNAATTATDITYNGCVISAYN